jgi:hypothetical protein
LFIQYSMLNLRFTIQLGKREATLQNVKFRLSVLEPRIQGDEKHTILIVLCLCKEANRLSHHVFESMRRMSSDFEETNESVNRCKIHLELGFVLNQVSDIQIISKWLGANMRENRIRNTERFLVHDANVICILEILHFVNVGE